MPGFAIRAQGLGKRYELKERERYRSLRDVITRAFTSRIPKLTGDSGGRPPDPLPFWALRDVSFEVQPGEVVGVIGRNGVGKSTLLKILSRVTVPTEGRVELHGRVGSLLEVGTGFHHELTGRENIYLYGSMLGMKKVEIERRFHDIVAFSEVEQFIDTPVKHYSSGMYVRLAFAVAAHLESEILLVDEALAVGDARFQKKCLNAMQEVSQQGRTVLFVTHDMRAITRLCPRAILLSEGRIVCDGPSLEVTRVYLQSGSGTSAAREWSDPTKAPGNDIVRLRAARIRTENGETTDAVDIRRPVGIEMHYEVLQPGHMLVPNYHVFNDEGVYVFVTQDSDPSWRGKARPVGQYVSTAWIPGNFLSEGSMIIGLAVSTMDPVIVHFYERDTLGFQVVDTLDGDSARGEYAGSIPGVLRPLLRWTTQFTPSQSEADTASAARTARESVR